MSGQLPGYWVETARHGEGGAFIQAVRGLESAMFHWCGRFSAPSSHYCTWEGLNVRCCSCGNVLRLPEPQPEKP